MGARKKTAQGNRLIQMLPARERERFLALCQPVDLVFAAVLAEEGDICRHVYFPTASFISLVSTLDDGARLEVGIVGDEGMLGTSLVLGVAVSPLHALVQGAGSALRMSANTFRRELEASPALRQNLNRYLHVLASQLAQTAACTRYHFVEARLAGWLLSTRDRAHSTQFHLTQEFMAYMLGVRRVGITKAAVALEKLGVIEYRRGKILILDEERLEKASCHCYRHAKEMYEATMSARSGASSRR